MPAMAQHIFGALCLMTAFHRSLGFRPEEGRHAMVIAAATRQSGNTISVNDSLLIFDVSLGELVGQGWGSRVLSMGAMHGQFTNRRKDRVVAMPPETLVTYKAFDLHPPVNTLPREAFGHMLADESQASVTGMQVLGERTQSGVQMINMWAKQSFAKTFLQQDLLGCWENFDAFVWQMFEGPLAKHEKPFADYIGLHIRHGDKVSEGGITHFSTVMKTVQTAPHWKDIRNLFLATDDLNVLEQDAHQFHPPQDSLTGTSQRDEYVWNWTQSRHRHIGGEPMNCEGEHCRTHHENTVGSIQAVLDDTLSLALAPVLVGDFHSNFFRLPWLLNYLRRTPEQRQEKWCWDVYSNRPCHDRSEFVYDFTRQVDISPHRGLGLRSDGTDLLRHCMDPTLEENQ